MLESSMCYAIFDHLKFLSLIVFQEVKAKEF